MKINSYGVNPLNAYNKAARAKEVQKTSKSFADQIEISSAAKEMTVASQFETERATKVSKLKADIQSGNYQIDARTVAEDMLRFYKY